MNKLIAYSAQDGDDDYAVLVFASTRGRAKSTALKSFKSFYDQAEYKDVRVRKIKDEDAVRLISELNDDDKKLYESEKDFFVVDFEGEI